YYERVFEPACANGELSVLLADRCASLLCQDLDPTAVHLARERLGAVSHASVELGRLPADWPGQTFDLIVLSEVGYYL
uniref:class I SAM-dependent methyltransferase n=1 Tax=Streptococcus mitis TaxID=28037 RepID=UPI0021B5E213